MKNQTRLAVREASHVEVLEPSSKLPAVAERGISQIVSIGKIPGEIREMPVNGRMTIRALFIAIGIQNLDRCEIQRNGQETDLDEVVEAGDTVLAIAKIRGN